MTDRMEGSHLILKSQNFVVLNFNKLKYMHLNSKDKCLQTLLDCWDMISEGEIFCYLK